MTKDFRRFLGVSQSLMADYLGITRSQLSMAESDRRSINSMQIISLLEFYKILTSEPGEEEKNEQLISIQNTQHANKQKFIALELKIRQCNLLIAERRLVKLQADQQRFEKIISRMNLLKKVALPHDEGLLEIIEIDAIATLKKTGEDVQFKVRMQIYSLRAEIDFLEQALNKEVQ